jgi:predicted transcriptional regulator
MASLRDAEQLTKDLESLVGQLKNEIRDGKGDFEKLTNLADEVSEHADKVAETFASMNEVLQNRISELNGGSSSSGGSSESGSRSRQSRGQRQKSGSSS